MLDRNLLTFALVLSCATPACQSSEPEPAVIANHDARTPEILGLERLDSEGAFIPGRVERFRALYAADESVSVSWKASAGRLDLQGEEVAWELPEAGEAALTLTLNSSSGRVISQEFRFSLATAAVGAAAVGRVDMSGDNTGSVCDLAFDSSDNPRIIYRNDTHPGLWYASWNGSAWVTELVDGMGYEVGGLLTDKMALAVDAAGVPHIAYEVKDKGIYYATRSGSSWTIEAVDAKGSGAVSIIIEGGKPLMAYTGVAQVTGCGALSRPMLAQRTGSGVWTKTPLLPPTLDPNDPEAPRSCVPLYAAGGLASTGSGTRYFTYTGSIHTYVSLGAYASSDTTLAPSLAVVGNPDYLPLALDGASRPMVLNGNSLFRVTPPLSSGVFSTSRFEESTAPQYDLAYANGKPVVVAVMGSVNMELATPDARGYWAYTSLGGADSSGRLSLAMDSTGAAHVCYRFASQINYR